MGNKYFRNLVVSLIGQLGFTTNQLVDALEAYGGPTDGGPQALWRLLYRPLMGHFKKMRPETLGRIVSCGRGWGNRGCKTSLYEVHMGSYLDKYADGKSLLLELACTAVVAEMTDILRPHQE